MVRQESTYENETWTYSDKGVLKEYVSTEALFGDPEETIKYDENGKMTERTYTEYANEVGTVTVSEKYGKFEEVIESEARLDDGTEYYEYKKRTVVDGNKVNIYSYTDDGKEYCWGYEVYSDDGKSIEQVRFYPNGTTLSKGITKYDESGEESETIVEGYDENGGKDWELCFHSYRDKEFRGMDLYDENGRELKYRYVYDSYGNCIGADEYYVDTGEKMMEVVKTEKDNEIEYKRFLYEDEAGYDIRVYDKHGNLIKEEGVFNLNGTKRAAMHKTEYKYIVTEE